jgi:hypothetical protein
MAVAWRRRGPRRPGRPASRAKADAGASGGGGRGAGMVTRRVQRVLVDKRILSARVRFEISTVWRNRVRLAVCRESPLGVFAGPGSTGAPRSAKTPSGCHGARAIGDVLASDIVGRARWSSEPPEQFQHFPVSCVAGIAGPATAVAGVNTTTSAATVNDFTTEGNVTGFLSDVHHDSTTNDATSAVRFPAAFPAADRRRTPSSACAAASGPTPWPGPRRRRRSPRPPADRHPSDRTSFYRSES